MKGVQSRYHVAGLIRIELAVFTRHQRAVLPICRIAGQVEFSAIPDVFPAEFTEDILLILHAAGYLIIP